MSRVEGVYKTPIMGVSKLAPRNRADGHAGVQENFRSNPVTKLTRRPSLQFNGELLVHTVTPEKVKQHAYKRDGIEYKIYAQLQNGWLMSSVNNVPKEPIYDSYFVTQNKELEFVTINDVTFVINPEREVELLTTTDAVNIERVSYLNILSALNYGETIRVNINKSGTQIASITYTVPDLGLNNPNYDVADKARATKKVAEELAQLINASPISYVNPAYNYTWQVCSPVLIPLVTVEDNIHSEYGWMKNNAYDANAVECKPFIESAGGIAGLSAQFLGSTVAVWSDDGVWLDLTIETGQGDRSAVAVNQVVEKVDGLPLYAVHGTRITVRPDPRSEKGIYYLEAVGTSENAVIAPTPAERKLEEVTWVESRSPIQSYRFNTTTMPKVVSFNTLGELTINTTVWDDREVGDNDSNPQPDFVNKKIRSGGYFQNRLAFLSDDTVSFTETDNIYNWWRKSAVTLVVSDRVGISSSVANVDRLNHVVAHNRDLLVSSGNNQFKIDGSVPLTPQTGALQQTATFENEEAVAPVPLGNSVYFAINYGDSVGIQEYTGEQNTQQDTANQISKHIIGYIKGGCKRLKGNANLGILAVLPTGTVKNELFIYEQSRDSTGDKTQASWSKWIFPQDVEIEDFSFNNNLLRIVGRQSTVLSEFTIDLKNTEDYDIYLDKKVVCTVSTITDPLITLPVNYVITDNTVVIASTGTEFALEQIRYEVINNGIGEAAQLRILEDVSDWMDTVTVVVGELYTSRYQPTRPYIRTEEGISITSDRLRIAKLIVNVNNTHRCNMKVTSDYTGDTIQEFNSRIVGNANNILGEVPFFTGDVEFHYGDDPDISTAEFYTDDHLALNILGIRWIGQYIQTNKRL